MNSVQKILSGIFFLCFFSLTTSAQNETPGNKERIKIYAGAEYQRYPAGTIAGTRIDFRKDVNNVNFRLGYNIARRKDFGKHDNEEGGGYGFSLGYRYLPVGKLEGWFAGIRSDIWWLTLDWQDGPGFSPGVPPLRAGTTKITVVQPVGELGYWFDIGSRGFIVPAISYGAEINVKTQGEPVGEGGIFSGHLTIGIRLN